MRILPLHKAADESTKAFSSGVWVEEETFFAPEIIFPDNCCG